MAWQNIFDTSTAYTTGAGVWTKRPAQIDEREFYGNVGSVCWMARQAGWKLRREMHGPQHRVVFVLHESPFEQKEVSGGWEATARAPLLGVPA